MGFRDNALRAVQDQQDDARRAEEARLEDLRRRAWKHEKAARKALQKWSKATGVPVGDAVAEPDLGRLRFTWSADGCEFAAIFPKDRSVDERVHYKMNHNGSEPPLALHVTMKDPEPRERTGGWFNANSITEIGHILSGRAWAEAEASRRAYEDLG